MKKLFVAAVTVVTCMSVALGTVAAQSTANCSIVNTGAGSNNTCNISNTTNLSITCTNSTDVVFVNGQSASSGSVTLEGNGSGGYTYSGDAVNVNSATAQLDVSCAAAQTTSTPPVTTTPVGTPATPQVQALPKTSNSAPNVLLAVFAALVALVAVSKLVTVVYRSTSVK